MAELATTDETAERDAAPVVDEALSDIAREGETALERRASPPAVEPAAQLGRVPAPAQEVGRAGGAPRARTAFALQRTVGNAAVGRMLPSPVRTVGGAPALATTGAPIAPAASLVTPPPGAPVLEPGVQPVPGPATPPPVAEARLAPTRETPVPRESPAERPPDTRPAAAAADITAPARAAVGEATAALAVGAETPSVAPTVQAAAGVPGLPPEATAARSAPPAPAARRAVAEPTVVEGAAGAEAVLPAVPAEPTAGPGEAVVSGDLLTATGTAPVEVPVVGEPAAPMSAALVALGPIPLDQDNPAWVRARIDERATASIALLHERLAATLAGAAAEAAVLRSSIDTRASDAVALFEEETQEAESLSDYDYDRALGELADATSAANIAMDEAADLALAGVGEEAETRGHAVASEIESRCSAIVVYGRTKAAALRAESEQRAKRARELANEVYRRYSRDDKADDAREAVDDVAKEAAAKFQTDGEAAAVEVERAAQQMAQIWRDEASGHAAAIEAGLVEVTGQIETARTWAKAEIERRAFELIAELDGTRTTVGDGVAEQREVFAAQVEIARSEAHARLDAALVQLEAELTTRTTEAEAEVLNAQVVVHGHVSAVEAEYGNLFDPVIVAKLLTDPFDIATARNLESLAAVAETFRTEGAAAETAFAGQIAEFATEAGSGVAAEVNRGSSGVSSIAAGFTAALQQTVSTCGGALRDVETSARAALAGIAGNIISTLDEGWNRAVSLIDRTVLGLTSSHNGIVYELPQKLDEAAREAIKPWYEKAWNWLVDVVVSFFKAVGSFLLWFGKSLVNLVWGFIWGETAFPDAWGAGVISFIGDVIAGVLVYGDVRDIVKWGLIKPIFMGEGYGWLNGLMIGFSLIGLIPLVGDAIKIGGKATMKALVSRLGREIAERLVRELGEEVMDRLVRELGEEVVERMVRELGPEAFARLVKEVGEQALKEMAERLGADLLAALAKELGHQLLKETYERFGVVVLKELGERLGGKLLKETLDRLGHDAVRDIVELVGAAGLKDLVDKLGKESLGQLTDAMGGRAAGELTASLTAAGVKSVADNLGAGVLGRLGADLGAAGVKRVLDDLGVDAVELMTKTMGVAAFGDLVKALTAAQLKEVVTTLGPRVVAETVQEVGLPVYLRIVRQGGAGLAARIVRIASIGIDFLKGARGGSAAVDALADRIRRETAEQATELRRLQDLAARSGPAAAAPAIAQLPALAQASIRLLVNTPPTHALYAARFGTALQYMVEPILHTAAEATQSLFRKPHVAGAGRGIPDIQKELVPGSGRWAVLDWTTQGAAGKALQKYNHSIVDFIVEIIHTGPL